MFIFIWENLKKVSGSYHKDGGAAVIANDENSMQEAINMHGELEINEEEMKKVKIYKLTGKYKEKIIIFPNAGCCDY